MIYVISIILVLIAYSCGFIYGVSFKNEQLRKDVKKWQEMVVDGWSRKLEEKQDLIDRLRTKV